VLLVKGREAVALALRSGKLDEAEQGFLKHAHRILTQAGPSLEAAQLERKGPSLSATVRLPGGAGDWIALLLVPRAAPQRPGPTDRPGAAPAPEK
jgi:hypothetical protein